MLYQGTCRFCNRCREFILKRVPTGSFEFVAIESELGKNLIKDQHLAITVDHPDSIVVLNLGLTPKYKWQACLEIVRHLAWPIRFGRLIMLVIPNWLGNKIYDWSARHRDFLCKIVRC